VLGVGLSLLFATIDREFGLSSRGKVVWQYMYNWETKLAAPWRKPEPAKGAPKQFFKGDSDGSVQLLLSPKNAATWSLNTSLLTLLPDREMPSTTVRFVEFYYVVSGRGLVSQSGIDDTSEIHAGDCFIIDPGSNRWIANPRGSAPLVLLRSTDGGNRYNRQDFDIIRHDPNRRSLVAMEAIKNGYKQIENLAMTYVNGGGQKEK
jgi:mannose-6-phosphate isomerase-like protein (cupin superfamily)